jgi:hypothetical protein
MCEKYNGLRCDAVSGVLLKGWRSMSWRDPLVFTDRDSEQDRQCTYDLTFRSVRVTIVTVEKQEVLHILCVCVCACVCAMRMRHVISPTASWIHHIFPHYPICGTTSEQMSRNKRSVFWFSLQFFFFFQISHSNNNSDTFHYKCTQVFMWTPRYSRQILIEAEVSRHTFKKILKYETPSSGSRAVPCGLTDGQESKTWRRHQSQVGAEATENETALKPKTGVSGL